MYSTPIDLGETSSNSSGAISKVLQIPGSVPAGSHTIVAIGIDSRGEEFIASLGVVVDNEGPEITSISVSQSTVAPGDTFAITIDANDPSGIDYVGFFFSVNGGQRDFCGQSSSRTSGTDTNGTWTRQCTVPASVIGGTYTITPFAADTLQNYTNTNCCSSSPARATFTVGGGSSDNEGPEITSISVSQSTVAPGDTFAITIDANDPSGIDYVGFFFSVNGGQRDFCGQSSSRTSGTDTNGTWTRQCTVPASVIGGTYTITPFAADTLQNYTNTNCCSSSPARATFTVQ